MMRSQASESYLRRRQDFPVLIVSQDYELFFQRSGSIEKCLFGPTDLLLKFARGSGIKITFFVDAGMLSCMQKYESVHPTLARELSQVKRHIGTLYAAGHEIGLHIHPHWEDTRWANGDWDFSGTRYQLREFSDVEVTDIVTRYTKTLNELCDGEVRSFRAGGFCIEPFDRLRQALLANGISVDSSIVPGARINDPDKGFDFRKASSAAWWRFDDSPLLPTPDGAFVEIPITATALPIFHYWGRALDRLLKRQPADVFGDGRSKGLGRDEIIRRLAGGGRVSELSMDAPKAGQLLTSRVSRQPRDIWHVMGHPKLLGQSSLTALEKFIARKNISRFDTVSGCAAAIGAQDAMADQRNVAE